MYSLFNALCALTVLIVGTGFVIYKIWTAKPEKREENAQEKIVHESKVEEPIRRKRGRPKGSKTLNRRYQGTEKGNQRRSKPAKKS